MKKKIGILLPYSGEFADLKRILLNPFLQYVQEHDDELIREFIGQGTEKEVSRAIDKLYYQEDADIIIGYIGYRVAVNIFDRLRRAPGKIFIHLNLGEVIPYTHSRINYPANYFLFSSNAWQSIAFLGTWVASGLPAGNCLVCTSLYDAGYSLVESFRVGYHNGHTKPLQVCTLKNPPNVVDVTPLFDEINRLRYEHLHITLCGRELDMFINGFGQFVDYTPSVSFSFPVSLTQIITTHPSFGKAYTAVPAGAMPEDINDFAISPFSVLLGYLTGKVIDWLNEDEVVLDDTISLMEMNFIDRQFTRTHVTDKVPAELNAEFNYSAENAIAIWQNPYLCI